MAECVECGDEYNDKRLVLGYYTCLRCGDKKATAQAEAKAERIMPLFNKGPLQYITDGTPLDSLGK